MKKVWYKWAQNSRPDLCELSEYLTKTECLCYHCGLRIPVLTEAILLKTSRNEDYILHKSCAEKSCRDANRQSRKK